ncbi:hypothetical protein OTK49_21670 [Vibrio coralliirubri]|uniref:hypothetical protein n=1 Tax=Vibrio coralliirubri TaxID=1516159 RepID=UPI00228465EC|nr:hypothetical protein [Vibrio coralliirubri]MCY9865132.1 hypothetical protein [Vibrio coralliirubri]
MLNKKMENITLSLTFAITELARQGVSPEDAEKLLTESNYYMEKVFDSLDTTSYSEDQSAVMRILLTRMFLAAPKLRNDINCGELISSIKSSELLVGHTKLFPKELSLTVCARAMNKYNDFVFLLMLNEAFNYDTYHRLIQVGNDEIKKALGASLAIFEKIAGGNISVILFSSILEDAISTSINPVIDSISKDSTLRQHFIMEPRQLLVPITAHVAEKVKNAVYLSDALVKVATK